MDGTIEAVVVVRDEKCVREEEALIFYLAKKVHAWHRTL